MHTHDHRHRNAPYGPPPGWFGGQPWWAGGRTGPAAGPPEPPRPRSELRIGDSERTEVTNLLIRHVADGRLTDEEFTERSAQAAAARTREDLDPLLADLPPLDNPAGQIPAEDTGPERPHSHRPWWLLIIGIVAAFVAVNWTLGLARWGLWRVPWILIVVVAFVVIRARRGRRRHW